MFADRETAMNKAFKQERRFEGGMVYIHSPIFFFLCFIGLP